MVRNIANSAPIIDSRFTPICQTRHPPAKSTHNIQITLITCIFELHKNWPVRDRAYADSPLLLLRNRIQRQLELGNPQCHQDLHVLNRFEARPRMLGHQAARGHRHADLAKPLRNVFPVHAHVRPRCIEPAAKPLLYTGLGWFSADCSAIPGAHVCYGRLQLHFDRCEHANMHDFCQRCKLSSAGAR